MDFAGRDTKQVAKRYWPLGISAFFLSALLAAWATAPADEWISSIAAEVAALGLMAPLAYVAIYVVGTVVLAPSPVMSIAAGVAFGWWGLPVALVAATAGATCSFLISRYWFDDDLDDWLTDRRIFRAIKQAVDEEGWKIQLLLRLSPAVPFGLLNYLMGLSNTPLRTYIWTTVVGILPGTLVDIYIGVIGQNLAGGGQIAYLAAGAIVTIASATVITWKARNLLREAGVKA
jgi:uncharacterized membrane protein YdjX (TVP38/TMEM64 family)